MAYSKRTWANGDVYNDTAVNDWEDRIEAGINAAGGGTPDDGSVTMAKFATGLVDTDNTLAADSDVKLATQKATKGYVTTQSGLLVPKSLIDAKGDLLVGTAADTVARKAVGANGKVLVAASGESDGLKWGGPTDIGAVATRAYRDTILADSPLLYWPLDDTYGATDQSGNSRDGTANGGITLGGYAGSPIAGGTHSTDFDGVNDSITIAHASALNGPGTTLSISVWVYMDVVGGVVNTIVDKDSSTGYYLEVLPGRTVRGRIAGSYYDSTSKLTVGRWTHLALTWDGANGCVYVDGRLDGSVAMTTSITSTATLRVGMRSDGYYTDCKISQLAIFGSMLTSRQVMLHYLVGVGVFA